MALDRHAASFPVYKGLQQPVVFKTLKGRYIYWGLASVLAGFLAAVILSVTVNFLMGFLGLLAVSFSGLLYTNSRQKKGLHDKTKSNGVYIIPARFNGAVGARRSR
ncbi:DUF4133 domain-containing protein [Pontibacter akesuensis]|uniref:DUF4133 domain-containing protein n=1 Tax=Pontibacter akesuensis TaxID=388950 RepID=A0A1I7KPJ5_9BACT|nr:DUF4133 domain-containing protein [Pontibacter akesuensis]GHA81709.1 DUF4133 domain-containing protein [Pontibacter akesuensis]SFU99286.1 protein of unknown function [Pontibacter akesuensis]